MSKHSFRDFSPGAKVRLSGKHLRNTGQRTGGAGLSVWTVLRFIPQRDWVVVNEPYPDPFETFTDDERRADPSLFYRRIATANLTIVGQLDSRDCP